MFETRCAGSATGRVGRRRVVVPYVAALVAIVLSSLSGVGGAVADEQAQVAMQPPEYHAGTGDRLRVTVFGHEDLSGEFQVDGTGYISMPLLGNVKAGDRTAQELAHAIESKLKPDYLKNPRVSVEVLNYRPFYILGEVNNPGSYPYVNGMTVLNAIALGGGRTYRGKENRVYIIRASDPERIKQQATNDTIVLPGDIIEVPERFF